MKYCLSITLLFYFSLFCNSQCTADLTKHATAFDKLEVESFTFLDDNLKDVDIVGLGEDTHGTAEFTEMAGKMMCYLAKNHGFRYFIIETGFAEGLYLNDYIEGSRDDLTYILQNLNSTWRYRTQEFVEMLNLLRSYNQTHSRKIQLYGCEMQYVAQEVNRLNTYLKEVGSTYRVLGFDKHLWQDITAEEKMNYYSTYTTTKELFEAKHEEFIQKTSEDDFMQAYHYVEILGQFVSAIHQNVEQRKHDLRDLYMAENIQWILYHGLSGSKALYWAHNGHVGDWISNGIVDVAGHHLKKIYGPAYYNIATDFGTGQYLAFSKDMKMNIYSHPTARRGTFSECLKNMGAPNVFLDLRNARNDSTLKHFLLEPLTTNSGAGAQVRSEDTETNDIGRAFDAMIYLDKTHNINWMTTEY